MNIIFLTFYYKPDLCAGSFRSTSIIEELLGKLGDNDHLYVLSTLPNRYKTYSIKAEKFYKDGNVEIHRFNTRAHKSGLVDQSLSFIGFAFQVLMLTRSLKPDIVVSTSSRLMTGVLGAYISAKNNCKFYVDIRDIFSESISELFSKKSKVISILSGYVFSKLEKYVITHADKVNLVSEGFIEYFEESGFNTKNWSFYPNGVDNDFVGKFTIGSRMKNKKLNVTYAGNIGEGQGLDRILPECAASLSDTHEFYVIGDGGGKDALIREIDNAELENITLVNPVDRDELLMRYQDADILFLHLNDYESFRRVLPSKIFEYVAMGKPIVAGVHGYSSDFLKQNVPHSIIFYPCDVNACVEAINAANNVIVEKQDVDEFIDRYRRDNISQKIALEIVDTCQE